MRSVEEARDRILGAIKLPAPIELPLPEAHGCVLAVDVAAEYDVPAFSSSEADGFAVRSADVHLATPDAPVGLRVVGESLGGRPPDATVGWGEAVRVAPGAPLPAGADCVVPLDRVHPEGGMLAVVGPAAEGEHIRPAGRDVRAGEVLIPAGRRLGAPELAVLATVGHAAPLAYPKLRVAVLSIGRGLVEPGRPVAFGQFRDAASFAVLGALRDAGAVPYRVGIVEDDPLEVREAVLANLSRADCFVCTVGSTDADLDPARFPDVGPVDFSDTAMYPGMRHGFGLIEGIPFFALSGSAVSAFVTFEVLVRPAILGMMGRRDVARPSVRAVLTEDVGGPSGVTVYAPVRVERREGRWEAIPTGPVDPDLLATVARSNGLVIVPPGDTAAGAGEEVRVSLFRALER
jgi:molybdopterin molybdotransferase